MVAGSEQKFLLGLGVSPENSQTSHLGVLLVHFSAAVLPCRFIPFFPVLRGQEGFLPAVLNAASYFMVLSADFTTFHSN